MKFLLKSALVLLIASTAQAHATKCEGKGSSCDYSVYRGKQAQISIYTTNCRYSDDNGGGVEIVEGILRQRRNGDVTYLLRGGDAVTFTGHKTAVLDIQTERVLLSCK